MIDFAVLFESSISYIITFAVGVGIAYLFLRNTGVEKAYKDWQKNQMQKSRSGWGKENIENMTKLELLRLFKFGKKENRTIFLGSQKIGKAKKSLNFGFLLNEKASSPFVFYLIESGFLGRNKEIYYINRDEITWHDDKKIYLENNDMINYNGIFKTIKYLDKKINYLDMFIKKIEKEDLEGRLMDFPAQAVMLDPNQARRVGEIRAGNEAFMQQQIAAEKKISEMM